MTVTTLEAAPLPVRDAPEAIHRTLAAWNARRLAPALPSSGPGAEDDARLLRMERDMLRAARQAVRARAALAPSSPDAFVAWFEDLRETGPGQHDPLFPFLAERAMREEMRWFLEQEAAGEAGFDDLVALTLVRMPGRAKLELARNFWDEMGRGDARGMHGPMLARLVEALDLRPVAERTLWPALALNNTMIAMACHRDWAYHSVGALGVIELTAPGRSTCVAAGLRRLGVDAPTRRYFDLHATLDVRHSLAWNAEVLAPLVEETPAAARAIAEGALMRLACGARCFEAYRAALFDRQAVAG